MDGVGVGANADRPAARDPTCIVLGRIAVMADLQRCGCERLGCSCGRPAHLHDVRELVQQQLALWRGVRQRDHIADREGARGHQPAGNARCFAGVELDEVEGLTELLLEQRARRQVDASAPRPHTIDHRGGIGVGLAQMLRHVRDLVRDQLGARRTGWVVGTG